MMRGKILIASLILLCVNVLAFASDAIITQEQRAIYSLHGLQGVSLAVDLSPNIQQHGLTVEQIQTDTEIKLKTAGIRVIPTEAGGQILSISVMSVYNPIVRGFAFHVGVGLHQLVILRRDPTSMMYAGTWSEGAVGFVSEERVRQIRDVVKDYVDKFISAYLTANPKK